VKYRPPVCSQCGADRIANETAERIEAIIDDAKKKRLQFGSHRLCLTRFFPYTFPYLYLFGALSYFKGYFPSYDMISEKASDAILADAVPRSI
jgi:hypothetical protein